MDPLKPHARSTARRQVRTAERRLQRRLGHSSSMTPAGAAHTPPAPDEDRGLFFAEHLNPEPARPRTPENRTPADARRCHLRYDGASPVTPRRTHATSRGHWRRGHQVRGTSAPRPTVGRRPATPSWMRPAPSAMQALYYGNVVGSDEEKRAHAGPQAASVLGIPTVPTRRFGRPAPHPTPPFRHAVMEIGSGVSDIVLVGGAAAGAQRDDQESTEYLAYASDAAGSETLGLTFPGVFALVARAHMAKYGTTEAQMAAVAVRIAQARHAEPQGAGFRKEITALEQVLKSAHRRRPLKLYGTAAVSPMAVRRRAGLRRGRAQGARGRSGAGLGRRVGLDT